MCNVEQGEPLLLLHGGLGSIDMFGPVLPRPLLEIFFAPALVSTVLPFLDGESGSRSWADQTGVDM